VSHALSEAAPHRIFHLAALTAPADDLAALPRYLHVNTEGTACVLAACASLRLKRLESVMVMGTAEEYGPDAAVPFREEAPARPRTPYGISKAAATAVCQAAWATERIPVTVLRGFLLYGPGQSSRFFVAQLVEAAATGRAIDMTAGEQTRDFLHVSDAVDGLLQASGCRALRGEVANLCSGVERSLREVVALWEDLAGMPDLVRRGALPYRRGEIFRYVGDPSKLRKATAWEPTVSMEEGLRQLLPSVQHT